MCPLTSRTVAYWLFARGQNLLSQMPVILYLLVQKMVRSVLTLKEQKPRFIHSQTIPSADI